MKDPREFANYKAALAARKVLLLATVGSAAFGLDTEESDIDEMGIVLEEPKDLIGFSPFEGDVYRTATDRTGNNNTKSEKGDIDLNLYGLRKFVRLALGGNPNLVTLLWLPRSQFSVYTPIGQGLQELAPDFMSKQTVKAYLGCAKAQRMRLIRDVNQPFGFDTKCAARALRLVMQAYDIVVNRPPIPIPVDYLKVLRYTRAGDYSLDETLARIEKYEDYAISGLDGSPLAEKPDYDKIERWLLSVYQNEWYGRSAVKEAPTEIAF